MVKILGWTNRTHSKLVRGFSKKLLKGIFGCPKLHFGQKKIEEKKFIFFSLFVGGTLRIFQEDFCGIFYRKIIRVPPYEK